MIALDDIDRAILRALVADVTQSAGALGRALGLSQPAAWRRIRRLEEAGVIAGRRLTLDADRRALRAMPTEFSAEPFDASDWMLRFVLPRGCFATALLQAVFDLVDLAAVPTIAEN